MTTDIRSRLVDRLKAVLDEKTANLPDTIPISVPVGPLADAVIEEMAEGRGVPLIPGYDAEVWSARRWTQPFTQEAVMDGGSVNAINVVRDDDHPGMVLFVVRVNKAESAVSLPADDAEEFLLAGLAAVAAAREVARVDAPDERG